jgi:hypothetical protein
MHGTATSISAPPRGSRFSVESSPSASCAINRRRCCSCKLAIGCRPAADSGSCTYPETGSKRPISSLSRVPQPTRRTREVCQRRSGHHAGERHSRCFAKSAIRASSVTASSSRFCSTIPTAPAEAHSTGGFIACLKRVTSSASMALAGRARPCIRLLRTDSSRLRARATLPSRCIPGAGTCPITRRCFTRLS